jgi:hypothetical protein
MAALSTIPNHYTIEFESSFDLKVQQTQSKLRGAVQNKVGRGERMRLNRLGTLEMVEITTRAGDTVTTDISTEQPNIFPIRAGAANLFDEFDEAFLDEVVLPDSEVVQTHAAAANRKIDNVIIAAMTGTAYIGKNGTTTEVLPSGQKVGVQYGGSANVGLTFEKIAAAAFVLDANEVPTEGRYIAIRAEQMRDLVADVLANHASNLSDIRMMPGTKVVSQILGFEVIQTQRVEVRTGDIAYCPAWQRDQVALAVWQDRKTRMDIRPDKSHALQIRTTLSVGATRKELLGVVEIACDQSP